MQQKLSLPVYLSTIYIAMLFLYLRSHLSVATVAIRCLQIVSILREKEVNVYLVFYKRGNCCADKKIQI